MTLTIKKLEKAYQKLKKYDQKVWMKRGKMKTKIYREQLEMLIGALRELEYKFPKADVFYDIERNGIQVVYPLPKDFYNYPRKERHENN